MLASIMILLSIIIVVAIKSITRRLRRYKQLKRLHRLSRDIKSALDEFEQFRNYASGYFNNYKLTRWKSKFQDIINAIEPFRERTKSNDNDLSKQEKEFNELVSKCEFLRKKRNDAFIIEELKTYAYLFDNIEGRSLDCQQRTAIVTNEDNNLVIAGAGSGKTSSIVGKVTYILERYKVLPERILVISFTKKSAQELQERIKTTGVNISTFHKLGKDIILNTKGVKKRVYEGDNFLFDLNTFIDVSLQKNEYAIKFMRFIVFFLTPFKSELELTGYQDKVRTQKAGGNGFFNKNQALNGKKLKSQEEVRIADFLSLNQVDYRYEEPYQFNTASHYYSQYLPDFTIYQNGRIVYLEHFGVDKNGNPPSWFKDREKYKQGMIWKRNLHKENKTILIETCSHEVRTSDFEVVLTKKLSDAGIILIPISLERFRQLLKTEQKKAYQTFTNLISTFLSLLKSNNHNIIEVRNSIAELKDMVAKERNQLFMDMFEPLYNLYENHLKHLQEIDFSDMLRDATMYINSGEYTTPYDFIIVDEFQDMSKGRYELLKALKQANPHCILYGVGDDWQSIYRFTGSDIGLFHEFQNYFGVTEQMKIETTYRFGNPLINNSSEFILKNAKQIPKQIHGYSTDKNTSLDCHYYCNSNIKNGEADPNTKLFFSVSDTIMGILDELIKSKKTILKKKSFLILGRYNFDKDKLVSEEHGITIKEKEEKTHFYFTKYPKFSIEYLTVHKAKGLEADIVFLVNCEAGLYGFPSEVVDDPILNLLLTDDDNFQNSEERRLFYVAITRAKEKMHLIINSQYPSVFIFEFENRIDNTAIPCPLCKDGFQIQRTNKRTQELFLSCSNFPYGCPWTGKVYLPNYS